MTDRKGAGRPAADGGMPYAPARSDSGIMPNGVSTGATGGEARTAGSAKGAARAAKSYNCPGEDTGYDFEELNRGQR